MKQFFKKCYLAIILIFLYIPIVVLICQSFNAARAAQSGRASPSTGMSSCSAIPRL